MEAFSLSSPTNSFFESENVVGYLPVCETSIYRNGITGVVYIYYKGKWKDVKKLNIEKLPEQYKRAICNSTFMRDYGQI